MSLRNIPGPLALPIWGNLYKYKFGFYNILKYHEVLEFLYKKYGPVVKEEFGRETVIHVYDPDDAKTIYQSEDISPRVVPLQETIQLYRENNDMSLGLGNMNGDDWYRLRSAVRQLMLQRKDVRYYLPKLNSLGDDLVTRISQDKDPISHEVPDLTVLLGKWAQESSGLVCFDRRLGCLDKGDGEQLADSIIKANKTVFVESAYLKFALPLYKYIKTPRWKRLVEAENLVTETARNHFNATIKEIESLIKSYGTIPDNRYNFLATLLSKPGLDRKDIMTITLSLYVDGLSTTLPSLLYNLYCLAGYSRVQEKAYDEITRVIKPGDPITSAVVNELTYVKNIVKEAFRMLPIGTEISRIIDKDLVLSGYEIPKDTHVNINMNVHFRSQQYFKEPVRFRPERWSRGDEGENIHPYVLTPFGFGARTCAGMRFAEQDLYLILTKIIMKFRLVYPEDESPLEQVYNTLLFPERPLRIKFIERNKE